MKGVAEARAEGGKDHDCKDVTSFRGTGLFIGVDLIKDETLRTPATEEAEYLVSRYFLLNCLPQIGNTVGPFSLKQLSLSSCLGPNPWLKACSNQSETPPFYQTYSNHEKPWV